MEEPDQRTIPRISQQFVVDYVSHGVFVHFHSCIDETIAGILLKQHKLEAMATFRYTFFNAHQSQLSYDLGHFLWNRKRLHFPDSMW